jgi:hypothetical protein
MSVSTSISACPGFAYDTWYEDLSMGKDGLANAADLKGV